MTNKYHRNPSSVDVFGGILQDFFKLFSCKTLNSVTVHGNSQDATNRVMLGGSERYAINRIWFIRENFM